MRTYKTREWYATIRLFVPGIVLFISIVLFFGSKLLTYGGDCIAGYDVQDYHFWNIYFFREQWLSGSFPLWNPYSYCGHPFLANPANFVLYPLIVIYLIMPLAPAFNLDILLHFFIAGIGVLLLVRSLAGSTTAGFVSSIIYIFCGYMIESVCAGHLTKIHSAAILPWIFYFTENAFRSSRMAWYLVLSGTMLGIQILTGNTQNNLYTIYFVSTYFVVRCLMERRRIDVQQMMTYALYICLIPVISFGLSAAQLIPSWELISLSDRSQETYEFATFMSFMPRNFFTFLVPKPETMLISTNWEFGAYVGILPLFLAGLGILFSHERRTTVGFLCMLIISVTLMLGSYTPLYRIYYHALPLIDKIRVPARAVIFFDFSIAILAGYGVKFVLETVNTRRLRYFCCPAIIFFLLSLYAGVLTFHIPILSKGVILATVFIFVSAGTLLISPLVRNRTVIAGILLLVIFTDLYLAYNKTIPVQNINEILRKQPYEQILEQDKDLYRVMFPITVTGDHFDVPSRGNVFHYYNVNGYIPIALNEFYQYMHIMAGVPVPQLRRHTLDMDIFQHARVLSSRILGIKYAIVEDSSGYTMKQAPWYMPRAVLCHEALVVPNRDDHITYIKNPRFNPTTTILLEKDYGDHAQSLSQPGPEDVVKITTYTPNRIVVQTSSAGNAYLLLSDLYYPGWKSLVDGTHIPTLRADYLLRAVPLQAGQHTVEFIYRPLSLYVGILITSLTILTVLILLISLRKKRKTDTLAVQDS